MEELTPEELARLGLIDVDPNTLKADVYRPDAPMARIAKVQERKALVLALRMKGASPNSIARVVRERGLGTDKYMAKHVSEDFAEAMKTYRVRNREIVRDLQSLEGQRLDHMWSRLDTGISAGIPASITCGISISKQRTALFGLNEDFQISVEEQVRSELTGVLDMLQLELSNDEYQKVLMAISGRNKVDLSDRLQTVEIPAEESIVDVESSQE